MSYIRVYENDPRFVLKAFREGEVDYIEATSELAEMAFFKFLVGRKVLRKLAETYPTPRKKEEVGVWFHISSDMSMRLHGSHSFRSLNYIWKTGGLIEALGQDVASKKIDPDTGNVIIECKGFNNKNVYDRTTPCDQDAVRKFSRDTHAGRLQVWYNNDVVKAYQDLGAFDSKGIFIGDSTYVFVPDNSSYEGSVVLVFDERGHPVNPDKLSREKLLRCQRRRCYKLITLLHVTGEGDLFICVGAHIVSGNEHEGPILWRMVERFCHGFPGVMKLLITDRGFINGKKMGECKKRFGVDTLIPVRKKMDIYEDIMGLTRLKGTEWEDYEAPERMVLPDEEVEKPDVIRRREETRQKTLKKKKKKEEKENPPDPAEVIVKRQVTGFGDLESWVECPIPLSGGVMREEYLDGHEDRWALVTTAEFDDPAELFDDYAIREDIEERHRQYKCFWDLSKFRSQTFSLVTNQIIFVLMTYSFLQIHLRLRDLGKINRQTIETIKRKLKEAQPKVIIYHQDRVAFLTIPHSTTLLLKLTEKARKKILRRTRQMWGELLDYDVGLFDPG